MSVEDCYILIEDLAMSKVCTVMVPKVVPEDLKTDRETISRDLLDRCDSDLLGRCGPVGHRDRAKREDDVDLNDNTRGSTTAMKTDDILRHPRGSTRARATPPSRRNASRRAAPTVAWAGPPPTFITISTTTTSSTGTTVLAARRRWREGRRDPPARRTAGGPSRAREGGPAAGRHGQGVCREDAGSEGSDGDAGGDSGGESNGSRHRHYRTSHRSVYRRLLGFVKQAWTGVKFALDSELEECECAPRYRPDSLEALRRATRFSESELKRIYRGFKAECPTGVVREDTFKGIYSQFFPQGANTSQYAHYVFKTLDQDNSGLLSFEDFVHALSVLSRGSVEEKLRWAFALYDVDGDGKITKEEMAGVVSAVYDLMGGRATTPTICIVDDAAAAVNERVEALFQKMDRNGDGVVTLEEFVESCLHDEHIPSSMAVFDSSF
ncbi:calsenilin-like [Hetaerina americana]|uniref:calsenilin-like n=1 Tax=Hetaerina americana TaxID=62018 RepID=UPI003A7F5BE2